LRTLQGMKANYGVRGGKIDVEWKNGLFVPVQGPTGLDKMASEAKADDVFVTILKKLTSQGRNVSHNPGPTYAPAIFIDEEEAKGLTKTMLSAAMLRLLNSKYIHIEISGPPSRQRSKLVLGEATK
jgi:hypothetical protein